MKLQYSALFKNASKNRMKISTGISLILKNGVHQIRFVSKKWVLWVCFQVETLPVGF